MCADLWWLRPVYLRDLDSIRDTYKVKTLNQSWSAELSVLKHALPNPGIPFNLKPLSSCTRFVYWLNYRFVEWSPFMVCQNNRPWNCFPVFPAYQIILLWVPDITLITSLSASLWNFTAEFISLEKQSPDFYGHIRIQFNHQSLRERSSGIQ